MTLAPGDRVWRDRAVGGNPRARFAGGRTRGGHGYRARFHWPVPGTP